MSNTILIIDDNKELSESTSMFLKLAGYKTLMAGNGTEGLELAHQHKPNLILCDISMPVLDGYGVLLALENIPEMIGTPFVFMSGKAELSDFRNGMNLGADDYLAKPFNGQDLLRIVSTRLKKSRMMQRTIENNNKEVKSSRNTEQEFNIFSDHKNTKKFRKKDMIFTEGDSPNFLHFIISGKIKTFKSSECGKEYIIDIHKEGDFFGYIALLEDSKHKKSAMAIENSEISLISKTVFFQLLYSDNEIAMKFAKLMSKKISEGGEKSLNLAYDSARKRVAEAILFVCKKYQVKEENELCFNLPRENISALSGISPESVSRNLTDFRKEGIVEIVNGKIKILNLKKLEALKN